MAKPKNVVTKQWQDLDFDRSNDKTQIHVGYSVKSPNNYTTIAGKEHNLKTLPGKIHGKHKLAI
jgi:hypothetical protein